MKIPDFSGSIKKLADFIHKRNIEKLIFKALVAIWLLVIIVVIILRMTDNARNNIEEKIKEAATHVSITAKAKTDIGKYEILLNLAKYPEGIEKYTREIKMDSFSEYKKAAVKPAEGQEYDFTLRSIDSVPLPMIYRGYIELPDKIIGQINWHEATRFVETGTTLNGYRICDISKEKIEAIDENGQKIEFELNKYVSGDELEAVLYDNLSEKAFNARLSSEIGDYKVVDIAPNHVILLSKGVEIRLEK